MNSHPPLTQGGLRPGPVAATLGFTSVNRPKRAVKEDDDGLSDHAWKYRHNPVRRP